MFSVGLVIQYMVLSLTHQVLPLGDCYEILVDVLLEH